MMFYKQHYVIENIADPVRFTSRTLRNVLFYKTCLVCEHTYFTCV